MRFRNTLILLGVLALLGAVVYVVEIRGQKAPPTAAETPPFLTFAVEDVASLQVETREGLRMVATRQGEAWTMEAPYQAEGDPYRLESALSELSLKPSRVLTETGDLAAFGLDSPWLTVTVTLRDGTAHALQVGDQNPSETSSYVQRLGQRDVLLMDVATVNQLNELATTPPRKPTPTATWTPAPTLEPTPTVGG